ncbi:MAG: hypothetical protein ACOVP4_12995 [Bacteriovoracaceae bacterium]|jgi:hypothetical protein
MKKTMAILLTALSLSALAQDVEYKCSFNTKVETIKTNLFGRSPRTVSVADFNPCQSPTVGSVIHEDGRVSLTECGIFTDEVKFGLTLRVQKMNEKNARLKLLHLSKKLQNENDYASDDVLDEKTIEIGKEAVFEANVEIQLYKKSRRLKEVITAVSVLCLKK